MGFSQVMLSASALVIAFALPVSAETPVLVPESADMWECPMADGDSIYTNKERAGCREMLLKPLSVVPSLEDMPMIPRSTTAGAPHYDVPSNQDRLSGMGMGGRTAPNWAQDWYASIAPEGLVQEEVCFLYSEWLHLAQKTRGGFFHGSDPSYGGDLFGRNQRGASHSFYDNARWVTLSKIFGTGFGPVGCL